MVSSRCKNCKLGLYLTVLRCIMYIILCPFKSKDFLFTLHFSLPYNPYSLFPWIKMSTFANTLAYPNHSSRWDKISCHLISREKGSALHIQIRPHAREKCSPLYIQIPPPSPWGKMVGGIYLNFLNELPLGARFRFPDFPWVSRTPRFSSVSYND
jgi:hypothetical protein